MTAARPAPAIPGPSPLRPARLGAFALATGLALAGLSLPAPAQTEVQTEAQAEAAVAPQPDMRQISTHMGEMVSEMLAPGVTRAEPDTLRFEPWQMIDEMFTRTDVVYLMRHGPTDWSKLDVKDVAPTDCGDQRILSAQGAEDMRNLGTLMAHNGILPGRIVVSEWCRNQQTLDTLFEGFDRVDPALKEAIPVETSADLNLLLSLQGAADVTALRERVSAWDGMIGEDPAEGPLLLISHYTNIEELTDFRVYEGEILVLDPDRDNRVLGYMRLKSAAPDIGHFDTQ